MLNKLLAFVRQHELLQPGDHVVCAISGGADSVALLFGLYLLRSKLQITVSAAHFNHRLRAEESDRDEQFVREFCDRYDIDLHVQSGNVVAGKKGLEAAARDARYAFLNTLPGKVATAHTADDNAETVLMHLVRGTGLKGLGGIAPVNGKLIRPMLSVTRQDVLAFLDEYHLSYVTDSSNESDRFFRNRLRHHVMPLLAEENPQIAENISALALRLRQDEQVLSELVKTESVLSVEGLQKMMPSIRSRYIAGFLQNAGVIEPESAHIALVDRLVFSGRPSARACLPGGVVIARNYDKLEAISVSEPLEDRILQCPGEVLIPELGLKVLCVPAQTAQFQYDRFTVVPDGEMVVRCRKAGDSMRLSGGTKDLKKLFIDRKIPSVQRSHIPVIADEAGVLGAFGFGANMDRLTGDGTVVEIRFEPI